MTDSPPVSPLSSPEDSGDDSDRYTESRLNNVLHGGDLDIPQVLISSALESEQLLDFGAWSRWIQDCPEFVSCACQDRRNLQMSFHSCHSVGAGSHLGLASR